MTRTQRSSFGNHDESPASVPENGQGWLTSPNYRQEGSSRRHSHHSSSLDPAEDCLDEKRLSIESSRGDSASENVDSESSSGRGDAGDLAVEIRQHPAMTRSVSEVRDGIESRRDVGLGGDTLDKIERTASSRRERDPDLVTWEGPDDPMNPKTWSFKTKWAAVVVVSFFTLISPVSSSMVAPALPVIGKEMGIESSLEQAMVLSIFILAYAIGPLFLGPLSELYGRVLVLQLSNLVYLFFNLGCGLARNKQQLIAFRFLSGFGGSAPLAIGGGVLSDLFTAEQRGRAISIYSLTPLLGPAIGPIAGGFITQRTTWRWCFYSTTIADAIIQFAGLFLLKETYGPVILGWKKKRLIKETGNEELHTDFDQPDRTVVQTLRRALLRPMHMLATQVIVQALALYMMYLYGLMYLVLATFPQLWVKYGESVGIGGLNYIAMGLGFTLGSQLCAPLQDRIYARLKIRYNVTVGRPEFRVPLMIPGAVLVPVGLFIYGWTAEKHTLWVGPDIGVVIFTAGTIVCFQCIQGYLVDAYTLYAASAVAAATVMRSLAGFGFPLFAPYLYDRLGYGWGNTLLGFIGIAIGWPAPILLWLYGEKLRKRSTFAAGG